MGTENNMRKCFVCGKKFYCDNLELWAYKRCYRSRETGKMTMGHNKVFCSYHCMREYQKGSESHRKI